MLKWLKRHDKRYYIYALIDPRNYVVHYIGISNDAEQRYQQHIRGKSNKYIWQWIQELRELDTVPILQIVETLDRDENKSFRDFMTFVSERERHWIKQYSGDSLLNVRGITTQCSKANNQKKNSIKQNLGKVREKGDAGLLSKRAVNPIAITKMKLEIFRIDIAVLTRQELATLADVSISSIQRAEEGKGVSRLTEARILKGLSKHIGRTVTRDEIDEFRE